MQLDGNVIKQPKRQVLTVLVKPRRWAQQHSAHYPKLGPILYVTSIQYFAVQLFVALQWKPPYNLSRDTISDLGNTACGTWNGRYVCSPLHNLMNTSFVVLGITMTLGSVLVSRNFANGRASKAGFAAMAVSGVGVIMVGFFPENSVSALHGLGAAIPFVLGNASLIIVALSLKMPALLRLYFFLSGVMALLGLVAYASSYDLGLGEGGIERVVAYPQTVCLIVMASTWPQRFRGGARLVTDRVVPVFGGCIWFRWSQRMADGPRCSGAPAPTAPGRPPFRVAGTGVAGQAGAGRAHSRCQQVRNASLQGQVRLIFRTRARAWRTSRAGRLSNR